MQANLKSLSTGAVLVGAILSASVSRVHIGRLGTQVFLHLSKLSHFQTQAFLSLNRVNCEASHFNGSQLCRPILSVLPQMIAEAICRVCSVAT